MSDEDPKRGPGDGGAVSASSKLKKADPDPPTETKDVVQSGQERADNAAEQVAHAETRRLEEAEEKAEKERKEAEKREQELERKQAEASEREQKIASESGTPGGRSAEATGLSAANITSPGVGLGSEPEAAAAAAKGTRATPVGQPSSASSSSAAAPSGSLAEKLEELPYGDRPEIQAGIAFASTFVLAKLLKILGS